MEHNDPSQRQYAPHPYATQQTQQPQPARTTLPSQYGGGASNDRFRQQSYLQQSPTAPTSAGRAGNDPQQIYGFQSSAQYSTLPGLQTSATPYAQNIPAQDPQGQAQRQYHPYGNNPMYGMAQPHTQQQHQQPTTSVYEQQMPQYRQRPNTESETLPAHFGVPQTPQYYLAGQAGPTSAPAPELSPQQLQTQYQPTGYPQPGQQVTQPYPSTMIDPSQSGSYAAYSQQPQYGSQQPAQSVDQAFNDYQSHVRSIFTAVRDGTLRDVGQQLMQISQYLLGNTEALGLTRDDDALHDDRIRLWDEFNRAWLATMQRQLDMTEEMLQSGHRLREPQSLMTLHSLEQLSRELVRLCDSIERHGLVDYQMGVSEEEIMELIMRCLSLLEPVNERTGEGPQVESSGAGAGRGR